MLHPAFRRLAEPRIWPLIGLSLWLTSCTSTAVRLELPLDHPANPEAHETAFRRPPPTFARAARESPEEDAPNLHEHGSQPARGSDSHSTQQHSEDDP